MEVEDSTNAIIFITLAEGEETSVQVKMNCYHM